MSTGDHFLQIAASRTEPEEQYSTQALMCHGQSTNEYSCNFEDEIVV